MSKETHEESHQNNEKSLVKQGRQTEMNIQVYGGEIKNSWRINTSEGNEQSQCREKTKTGSVNQNNTKWKR